MKPTIETHTSRHSTRLALACVAVAAIAMLSGCGTNHSEQAASAGENTAVVLRGSPVEAVPASAPAGAPRAFDGHVVTLGDSLPPELAVSVEDTLVRPGDVIEITAEGSDDVAQMGLSDAIGRVQLFSRDPSTNTWRVLYRVPLKASGDRIGLSVTGMNDLNRWRRVWVFLRLKPAESPETPETPAASTDSGAHS